METDHVLAFSLSRGLSSLHKPVVAVSVNLSGAEWKNKEEQPCFRLRNWPKNGQSGLKRMDIRINEIAFHGPLCVPLKPKFHYSIDFVKAHRQLALANCTCTCTRYCVIALCH